ATVREADVAASINVSPNGRNIREGRATVRGDAPVDGGGVRNGHVPGRAHVSLVTSVRLQFDEAAGVNVADDPSATSRFHSTRRVDASVDGRGAGDCDLGTRSHCLHVRGSTPHVRLVRADARVVTVDEA